MIRCKIIVISIAQMKTGSEITSESVRLCAVNGPLEENKQWSKFTPSANFEMTITNPAAMNKFEQGKSYFVDFTPSEN